MIAFDLRCEKDHVFEAWFKDNLSFERQKSEGLLACPICGSNHVEKALSAVAVRTGKTAGEGPDSAYSLMKVMEKFYSVIENNTTDVGADFAKEALKMHYGVSEPRGIRGIATEQEEKILRNEGISFVKIPMPVKKRSN